MHIYYYIFFVYNKIRTMQGCTATLLLVWAVGDENLFAQCANLGDSACVIKYVSRCHPSFLAFLYILWL